MGYVTKVKEIKFVLEHVTGNLLLEDMILVTVINFLFNYWVKIINSTGD